MHPRLALLLSHDGWQRRTTLVHDLTLGRGSDCDVQVADPHLSRQHCRLRQEGDAWLLEDLDSRGGTTLNGMPVAKPERLAPGDRFRAGQVVGELVEESDSDSLLTGEVRRDMRVVLDLLRSVRAVQEAGDLPAVIRTLVAEALTLSELARGAFVLPSGERVYDSGAGAEGGEAPDLLRPELVARTLASGRSAVTADERGTAVCLPCAAQDGLVGAVYLESPAGVGIDPRIVRILEVIALHGGSAVAIAATNAAREREAERKRQELEHENRRLRSRTENPEPIGQSPALLKAMQTARQLAPSSVTVCITGETGTGKEVFARYMHGASHRAAGPFVAVDCGAIPTGLIEAELFGHARGAFTGATSSRLGRFREAEGGTVFLDEIAELPIDLQTRLLRVLEEGSVQPVGERGRVQVDVRVICATHRDLERAVAEGRFRQDLYFRVAVVSVPLPPLRERGEDIALLALAFLRRFEQEGDRRFEGFTQEALAALAGHAWPGNVRELQHRVRRAVLLGQGPWLSRADLDLGPPEAVPAAGGGAPMPLGEARRLATERFEQRYLEELLGHTGGNVSRAATVAGVARQTIQRLMQVHGVRRGAFVAGAQEPDLPSR